MREHTITMKTVKFVDKDKGREFTATLRRNVHNYFKENKISTKGNYKMILKSIVMISLYLIPFILILTLPLSGWIALILFAIMGFGMAGIGMNVMHDAAHGSFSKRGWLNKLFSSTMYIIGGNTFNWKVQHNVLHHTFTNIEGYDEDIEPKGYIRMSHASPIKKIHRFQHIYAFFLYCFMSSSRLVTEFKQLFRYNKSGLTKQQGMSPRKEMMKLTISKIAYLIAIIGLPLLVSALPWWWIILGFVIVHAIAGLVMGIVFQMAHLVEEAKQPLANEQGEIHKEWSIHELETTANFSRKSRWFGWCIGGLNFQVEHHLFPNICHIHYPFISPIVERTALEYGLAYNENKTFFNAIGSHIRMLRTLGRNT